MAGIVLSNALLLNGKSVDLLIEEGRIKKIGKAFSMSDSQAIDCSNMYISSGWIDLHVHALDKLHPYGDEIDKIGVNQGVTTIVDAGSCGADAISELYTKAENSMTNVFALLNISRIGLRRVDELSDPAWIDKRKALAAIDKYPDFIVGLKARMSASVVGEQGIEPLYQARELSSESGLPLMVHIGSAPPQLSEILPLLQDRDVVTHYLNGKSNSILDDDGHPIPALREALSRGVQLDVGHGTASFSFATAERAKAENIPLGTISTDIYRQNRLRGPVFNMGLVLSKFLALGYTLEEVISSVTDKPAKWLERPELGRIEEGHLANLTIFEVADQAFELIDSEGKVRIGEKIIIPKGVVIKNEFIEC